jgi:hypothetical protein
MTSTRSLLCGCCASALVPVTLAARRGHGPSATPPARGRSGAGTARQGVRGYSPPPPAVSPIRGLIDFHPQMFVAALEAAGISRDQIQTLGRETPTALLMG